MLVTYNYSLAEADAVGEFKDKDIRNNMKATGVNYQTLDFYINYLTTLQRMRDKWQNFGCFDLGMVPVAMGPLTAQPYLFRFFRDLCDEQGIQTYSVDAVGFLTNQRIRDIKDLWVFREDIAKTVGKSPLSFSIIDYISREEVKERWAKQAKSL